jgi:arsenate reductase
MKEIGIDISNHTSKIASDEMMKKTTHLISMGCGVFDSCPVYLFSNKVIDDWGLDDPVGQPIEKFREVRDQIKTYVEELIEKIKQTQTQ